MATLSPYQQYVRWVSGSTLTGSISPTTAPQPSLSPSPTPTPTPTQQRIIGGVEQIANPTPRSGSTAPRTSDPGLARRDFEREAQLLFPWLPPELLRVFVDEMVRSGRSDLALAAVRSHKLYDQFFPGIRRADGSLRMDEQTYMAHREGFRRELLQWGLNPELFEHHHVALIEGDVSVAEFARRIGAKIQGVLQNIPQVRAEFGRFYGISDLSDQAFIAAAIDPQIGLDLLQGRITAAQIGGEASARGFERSRERAEELAFAGQLTQQQARQLFGAAQTQLPQLQTFAERFHDPKQVSLEQFEDVGVFGDQQQAQRFQRLRGAEQSIFSPFGGVREDARGLLGLRPQ